MKEQLHRRGNAEDKDRKTIRKMIVRLKKTAVKFKNTINSKQFSKKLNEFEMT